MTRIAVHHWQHRIAPVFDIGGEILVLGNGAGTREEHLLQCSEPLHRAEELCALSVGTLICGAISRSMSEALAARGITVVGFVAGDLDRVVAAWEHGGLDETFAMPGCRGACRGRGAGEQRAAGFGPRRAETPVPVASEDCSDIGPGGQRRRARRGGRGPGGCGLPGRDG
ncbi:NifB/NifX family molybdenum-iron cluster-binding protein [Desulfomicrobium escambiense]|uniref:NifB/NifX family molybdenum-iron cluster-binding protein n=1 Tax=Desulfomicrobium escambiense TaxID=29503 RepID=UPI000420BE1A|nr:hypothetical protein [Desulfomicrobium escambiense]